jgi:hypothetical protein
MDGAPVEVTGRYDFRDTTGNGWYSIKRQARPVKNFSRPGYPPFFANDTQAAFTPVKIRIV